MKLQHKRSKSFMFSFFFSLFCIYNYNNKGKLHFNYFLKSYHQQNETASKTFKNF